MRQRERKIRTLPCERFLQRFECFRAFLPPVSYEGKRGNIQNTVKIAHKAFILIFLSL